MLVVAKAGTIAVGVNFNGDKQRGIKYTLQACEKSAEGRAPCHVAAVLIQD